VGDGFDPEGVGPISQSLLKAHVGRSCGSSVQPIFYFETCAFLRSVKTVPAQPVIDEPIASNRC
jgi:hypothetical protein